MDPQVLVIFGASGDLARRKLIPALHSLHIQKRLPVPFAILGIGRTPLQDDSFREEMRKVLPAPVDPDFLTNLYFTSLDTENFDVYSQLRSRLDDLCSALKIPHNIVYYLAVPPGLSERIPQWLAALKMQDESDGHKRIVMEKPFGHDLQSAQALNRSLLSHWTEHQVYRIDHFLGKETVQNLLVFRFANEIFDSLWNHRYVDYVEITAAENLGVGTRAGYFDHTGIVRDMVQNHLLQVLAMVAMDPPLNFDADCVRHETMKVFKSLRPLQEADFEQQVVFGQYEAAHVKEGILPGYLQEPGIAHISRTETFAALKIFVDHPRWFNVPFYLRTGKRMPTRVTEVVLHFKKTPHPAFGIHGGSVAAQNQLVLRIQPDEGILLKVALKEPGAGFRVKEVNMDFHYADLADTHVPEAYERLLLDVMQGDATLFALGDAVETCWQFIDPILQYHDAGAPLHIYPAGSWGPREADDLLSRDQRQWRYPCKNLAEEGACVL